MGYPALDLASKTAVVIGGTSGIGLALAEGLAQAGADVVATGRRGQLVECATGKIRRLGRRSLSIPCDVTDRGSLEELHRRVCAEFGHVDILVNSAGVTRRTPFLNIAEAEWNAILDVNLNGTLRACQIFGKDMVTRGYGRIINIASLASFVGFLEVTAYAASKAAVAALTKSLAVEWSRHGVCVNAIAPGVFQTDLNASLLNGTQRSEELLLRTPMRRFGRVEELVGACVFLASDAAGFVTGHVLVVDGGFLASGVNQ
ncbi:MAG TPA: glucose 1-dehydrogenase [Alphaproteobacteria bacterium]|nr:glucose 1-dehydrogenase [Alphaproteobacteria bacterium]